MAATRPKQQSAYGKVEVPCEVWLDLNEFGIGE